MSSNLGTVGLRRITTYVVLLIFLLAFVGLLAVNYAAGLALIVGLMLSLFVVGIWLILLKFPRRLRILASVLIFLFFVVIGSFMFLVQSMKVPIEGIILDATCLGREPHFRISTKSYQIVIEHSKAPPENLIAKQQVDILQEEVECKDGKVLNVLNAETKTLPLPDRQIESKERGFLLKEVNFTPPLTVTLELPNGNPGIITVDSRNTQVELRDMPKDSFYKAKDAENLVVDTYIDTQTVRWSPRYASEGIVFAFIPTPFNVLRPLVAPFVGISSWNEWLIAIIALVAGLVLHPIVTPVLTDIAKTRFKSWFERRTARPTETGKLVISGKGEEKEIKIKK